VGQLVRCDICHTSFRAPVYDTPPASSGQGEQRAEPDELDEAGRIQEGSIQGPSDRGSYGSLPASDENAPLPHAWPSAEAARSGEQSGQPSAEERAAGAGTGEITPRDQEVDDRSGVLWLIVTMCAVGVMLAAGVVAVMAILRALKVDDSTVRERRPASAEADGGKQDSARWADATRYSQRRKPITVSVERASYGSLRAKDLNHRVITTADDNLLAVVVSVRNLGERARSFRSWYGHAFEQAGQRDVIATLNDDQGRSYSLLKFDDVTYVEGQRLADRIEPQQEVRDTVVFLIPEEVDRSAIDYFRLALPAAAVGLPGFFRFRIPVEMIDGFRKADGDSQTQPEGEAAEQM
jgi:hypothetical protein